MKLYLKTLIVAVLFIFAINGIVKADEIIFEKGTFKDVLSKAKEQKKVLMVDFYTDWCKWCVELDRKVYTENSVAGFANKNQINWKVDAEKGEGIDLAKKYNISGFPTIVFIDGNGKEIDRIVGYYPAPEFLQMMKDYNSGVNTTGSLKDMIKKDPNDPEANYKLAEKKINNEGKMDEAKVLLEKVIKADPQNKKGYTDDAAFLLASLNGNTEDIQKFINDYPNSDKLKDAYASLADLTFNKSGDFDAAKNIYAQAFEKFGKSDPLLSQSYGQLLITKLYKISQGETSTDEEKLKAIEIGNECLEYVKGSVNEGSVYYYLADLYFKTGNKENANTAIDKALIINDKKTYRELKEKINN